MKSKQKGPARVRPIEANVASSRAACCGGVSPAEVGQQVVLGRELVSDGGALLAVLAVV